MRDGWQTTTLESMCDILDSQRMPITKRDRVSGDYPYYGATGIVDFVGSYIFNEPLVLIGEDGAKWGAGENSAFKVDGRCWVNNHAHVIRPHRDELLDSWAVYYLNHTDLIPFISGLTVPKLNQGALRRISIPLPPLDEQQRIVRILDEAFDAIATAKTNAECNLANARLLVETAFAELLSRSKNTTWQTKNVSEIALPAKGSIRTGPFGSQLLHGEFVDQGIAVLGIDNVVANEFRWGKGRFITPAKYDKLKRYRVHPGDVLITIMGTCGRCAIVPDDIPTAINTKHICCITLDHGLCLPEFLQASFLYAPDVLEFLAERTMGSIMDGLNMSIIKELPVSLPPITKQQVLVEALEGVRRHSLRLESLYRRKLAALDELKQSLLHQAFAGEL